MKFLLKSILFILISITIVYFMSENHFLELASIQNAFIHNKVLIVFISIFQILLCFIATLRYFSLLKTFNINVDFKNVTAATFVSNGLGLWLPGSMAFIEIIRIGLMLGAEKQFQQINANPSLNETKTVEQNKDDISLRSRLTTVSLFDRLIGLWTMLLVGLFFISGVIIKSYNNLQHISDLYGLIFLLIFTTFLLFFISFLPLVSKSILIRKILERVERFFFILSRGWFLQKIFKKIFIEINSILDAIAIGGKKFNCFYIPILYSFLCVLIQATSIYYSAIAISVFIPFSAILATISILALATLLPIGFGGIGGVQLVAAITMSFFGVIPHNAASAQFLQSAINLLSISFAGLFFTKLTFKQFKSTIDLYKSSKHKI